MLCSSTFGTQLGNSLSACEVNGLLNGTATQGQLDMFASRAGEAPLSHINTAAGCHFS